VRLGPSVRKHRLPRPDQATAAQEAAFTRFYERLGFAQVARLPRYYHGRDFLEYVREPLPRGYQEPGAR
jgi:hypothetical protein